MVDERTDEAAVMTELVPPQSGITPGKEWLVMAISKMWTGREGRRGVVDPSGGLTLAPAYNTEILLAFPLVVEPKEDQPEGTLTLDQFDKFVVTGLRTLNEKIVDTTKKQF